MQLPPLHFKSANLQSTGPILVYRVALPLFTYELASPYPAPQSHGIGCPLSSLWLGLKLTEQYSPFEELSFWSHINEFLFWVCFIKEGPNISCGSWVLRDLYSHNPVDVLNDSSNFSVRFESSMLSEFCSTKLGSVSTLQLSRDKDERHGV